MEAFKVLVYGYGNPGRRDDGLGVEIVTRVEKEFPGISVDYNYQLNAEDSFRLSEFDSVIFVDASLDAVEPYEFKKIEASHNVAFTTHSMSPQTVLSLCHELYDRCPDAFVLAIRGYEWELEEGLSVRAQYNCEKAYEFLSDLLREPSQRILDQAAYNFNKR